MNHTPAATSVQLARAEVLGKALVRRGWTSRREPRAKHPGAIGATTYTRPGLETLILTFGGRHGQMVEITAQATYGFRGEGSRRVRAAKPSWRLTAYDAPIAAVLAAATAGVDDPLDSNALESAGWRVEHALAVKDADGSMRFNADASLPIAVKVLATRFTRPDGALRATFHLPTYTPPCEHCTHHGELGGTGGWIVAGPGFTAEATAHIPTSVIGAFVRALPGSRQNHPAAPSKELPVRPRNRAESVPVATSPPGTRLTAVVC